MPTAGSRDGSDPADQDERRGEQRAVRGADVLLQPGDGAEERRVGDADPGRIAREWAVKSCSDESRGDSAYGENRAAAAAKVEAEGDRNERQERVEVALLEALRSVGRVERGFEEDKGGEARRERRERHFSPSPRERDADERARDQRNAGGKSEQEEVDHSPAQGCGAEIQVEDSGVVPEQAPGPERERSENPRDSDTQQDTLRPRHASSVD